MTARPGGGPSGPPPRITRATAADAAAIAEIHLSAVADGMPWLARPYTDAETRRFFKQAIGRSLDAWWIARVGPQVVGYVAVFDRDVDHLYVAPGWQGQGIGTLLLDHAKRLSPLELELFAFERNVRARRFYERHGFRPVEHRDGRDNEEGEPDIRYAWQPAR